MVDKLEPPVIPDGYALTLGFASLLEICHSVEVNVLLHQNTVNGTDATHSHTKSQDDELQKALVKSSWAGLLASLTLLLEAR